MVGNTAPTTDNNKDRGIEFRWHDGTTAKLGFFGFDDSTGKFTFIPDASNSSEVFSGSLGEIDANITWDNVIGKPTFVNSLTGTPNEINVTSTTGAIVISLPSTVAINISGTSVGWTTPRKITLTGDLEGNVMIDGGSNVTLSANIIANAVSLGTDTTGDYVANLTAGTGITITSGTGEQSQPIIAVTNNTYDAYGSAATAELNAANDASTKATTAYNNAVTYVDNEISSLSIDDLSDVNVSLPQDGDFLRFNQVSNAWINDPVNLATDTVGSYVASLIAGNNISISNNSGEGSTPTISVSQDPTFGNITTTHLVVSNKEIDTSNATAGQVLKYNGVKFVPDTDNTAEAGQLELADLGDVVFVNPINGSVLRFDGTNWTDSGVALNDISDVTITTASNGQFLKYNGSSWINASIAEVNNLNDISDVTITSASNEQVLQYNGSAWINSTLPAPITDHGSMGGLLDDDHTQYLNTARHDSHDHGAAFANTSNATLGGNLTVTGNFSVNGSMIATSDVTVSGNLTVNGNTVTINAETLVVEDKTVQLGTSLSPSNTTADGSGIVIPDGSANKTFIWVNSTGSWTLSEHLNLAANKVIKMGGVEVLSSTNYTGHAASASQATIASSVVANSVTPSMLQEGPAKAAFRSEILTINSNSYTLIISDLSKLILMNNTSPMTVTIPSESNVAFDNGDRIDVTRYGTGSLTFAAQAGVTLKSTPGLKLRAQYSTATLTKLGTNEWLIVGDLAA